MARRQGSIIQPGWEARSQGIGNDEKEERICIEKLQLYTGVQNQVIEPPEVVQVKGETAKGEHGGGAILQIGNLNGVAQTNQMNC